MNTSCFRVWNLYFQNPMKLRIHQILALALVSLTLIASSQAQTTVTTDPVGFTNVVIAPSVDGTNPAGTVISTPFHTAPIYAGTITSVDGSNSFSDSSAAWTASQFVSGSAPCLVKIKSGASVGRAFLVTVNGTNQITVNSAGYNLTTLLSASDSYQIIPANTLTTLFTSGTASGSFPFQIGASAASADDVCVWNGSGWIVYYNNGTNWKQSGSLISQNNTIIYPDEALYILRRSMTPLTVTFAGTIPTTNEKTDVPGGANTFLANRYPQDMVLYSSTSSNSLSLQNIPNWQSGSSAASADKVCLWTGSGWSVYYYNGTNWKKSGSLLIQDSTVVPANSAMYISRMSSSGTNVTFSQLIPYSL